MSSMSIGGAGRSGMQAMQGAGMQGMHGVRGPMGPPPPPRDGGALKVAADTLGMAPGDVLSALQDGKSLDDLATDQGVPHEDLVAALKAGMPSELRNGDLADALAEKIATTKGVDAVRPAGDVSGVSGATGTTGARGPAGGPPPGPPPSWTTGGSEGTGVFGAGLTAAQSSTLDALASLLGTDGGSLLDDLRSGTSLSELVTAKGVDSGSLASVLQNGLLYDRTA